MDQKVVLIVFPVQHLITSKRHISYDYIKKAVRQICVLKALSSDGGLLVKLLCDPGGNAVDLHTVNLAVRQTLRFPSDKISRSAAWLQNVPGFQSHVLQRLIHGADDHRRRIKGGQRGLSRRSILFLCQDRL